MACWATALQASFQTLQADRPAAKRVFPQSRSSSCSLMFAGRVPGVGEAVAGPRPLRLPGAGGGFPSVPFHRQVHGVGARCRCAARGSSRGTERFEFPTHFAVSWKDLVRIAGLEPARITPLPPQSSASANSAICALSNPPQILVFQCALSSATSAAEHTENALQALPSTGRRGLQVSFFSMGKV